MKTLRTLLLLTFAIMIGEPIHAESFCFRKEKDAWRILIANEVLQRAYSKMERLQELETSVQKRMLKNCYRQYLEKENDKEEYEKLCRDLEDDSTVGLLVKTLLCRESWF